MMRMEAIRRRSLMENAKPSHTVLSYLQSTGTQYINTGIKGQNGLTVEISTVSGFTNFLFGSRVGYQSSSYYIYTGRFDYYNTAYSVSTSGLLFKIIDNKYYLDGNLLATGSTTSFNNNLNCYLFGCNSNGSYSAGSCKIYYSKVWNSSGTLIQSLIPVIKNSVYCMYDQVTGTYFYNQGTGSFTGA